LTRAPTHTAEARITVGRIDVPAFSLQGVVIGNQTLAGSYARLIGARPVTRRAGRAVELGPDEARGDLRASPIPGSTLIRVEADADSDVRAIRLANSGSRALIAYVEDLNRRQQSSGLLRRYKRAQNLTDRRRAALERLKRGGRAGQATLQRARVNLLSAQLRSQRLSQLYAAGGEDPSPASLLQLANPADSADSDFMSVLERLLLVAVAAGLAIGVGLALLKANGDRLRRGMA
jgi:capsular polysaccharide biosynthesis protein